MACPLIRSVSRRATCPRDPLSVADAVRAEIWNVDARQPVADVSTMELAVERFVVAPRFRTMLLAAVAALGLLLAIVGVHAVVSYLVSQRAPEMALRLALGAEPRQIGGLVLRQGLALASAGILVGVAGSLVFTRLMSGVLFGVTPVDSADPRRSLGTRPGGRPRSLLPSRQPREHRGRGRSAATLLGVRRASGQPRTLLAATYFPVPPSLTSRTPR